VYDVGAAVRVARWCLRETLRVYEALQLNAAALDPPERFLRQLPRTFATSDARAVAAAEDVPERTMFKWLSDLQEDGTLEKKGRGRYRKAL